MISLMNLAVSRRFLLVPEMSSQKQMKRIKLGNNFPCESSHSVTIPVRKNDSNESQIDNSLSCMVALKASVGAVKSCYI